MASGSLSPPDNFLRKPSNLFLEFEWLEDLAAIAKHHEPAGKAFATTLGQEGHFDLVADYFFFHNAIVLFTRTQVFANITVDPYHHPVITARPFRFTEGIDGRMFPREGCVKA